MDYFPILFNPPVKCGYDGLWGKTHGDTPSLSPLALPLHTGYRGWCSRQASRGVLPFPSWECATDMDGVAETFPLGLSWLLVAGVNFS